MSGVARPDQSDRSGDTLLERSLVVFKGEGDLAKLALQFSVSHPDIHTTIVGTANPNRILENIRQIEEPIDLSLLEKVQEILKPIRNVTWPSGRSENN